MYDYFKAFVRDASKYEGEEIPMTCWRVFEFVKRIAPRQGQLVHYSGYEDHTEYNDIIMTDGQLIDWTNEEWGKYLSDQSKFTLVRKRGLSNVWHVPIPGERISLKD